jgi:nicotinate dehydrogenase subunit B
MKKFDSGPSIKAYNKLNHWFDFNNQNVLKVYSGKVDIGQHISSTLALITSRITGIKYDQIEIIKLNTDLSPNEGITASSLSVANSGSAIKAASITLKTSFTNYALKYLKIQKEDMIFENGIIKDRKSNISLSYWDFSKTDEFKKLTIPESIDEETLNTLNYVNNQKIELKTIREIVKGTYKYVHDMNFPEMFHARIIRPPSYHSKLLGIDEGFKEKLKKNKIELFVEGSFVAILSNEEFLVVKYLELSKGNISWDNSTQLSNDNVFNSLKNNEKETLLVKSGGEAFYENVPENKSFNDSRITTLSSEYKKSYLMHGPIGPSASCAIYKDNKFTIYTHSQSIFALKQSISKYFEITPDNVSLNFMPGSGCYGHNGADDVAFEVSVLSKQYPNKHILLKWSREDEHCWEPYGSASMNKIYGAINDDGIIIYWSNEAFSDTYLSRPSDTELNNFISLKFLTDKPIKQRSKPKTAAHMGIHRNLDPLYTFNETRLVKNLVHDLPLRTSALRTLGAFANVTASESFINELALIKNIDPFDIRINHLQDDRAIDVLNNLKINMNRKNLNPDCFRGIGFSRYKNSAAYCAVGVEIKISDNLDIKLINAWISVDAGEIAFEDGIKAQVEGGFIQAASWSLYEEVLFDSKEIISKDWDNYKIIGFDNIPNFYTNVIDRKGYPYLGVGEAVAGPTGAAISNAISDALGQTIKTMPFTKEIITKELLKT